MKKVGLLIFILFAGINIFAQKETLLPVTAIQSTEKFLLIPETREHSIQFNDSIRPSWLHYAETETFTMNAQPGEYFVFQVAAIALQEKANTVKVNLSPFSGKKSWINVVDVTCFNTSGMDYKGAMFEKNISIEKGIIQPLWIGVRIPKVSPPESYAGEVEVVFNGNVSKKIKVKINVSGEILEDGGVSNPNTLSKLQWLNSGIGINNELTKEHIALTRTNQTIKILGRDLLVDNGLPQQIHSYFTGANDKLSSTAMSLLSAPFVFKVLLANGQELLLKGKPVYNTLYQTVSCLEWTFGTESPELKLFCTAVAEYDGYIRYDIQVIGKKAVEVKDIRLEFSMPEKVAEYAMGMGIKGGYRPKNLDWKWDVEHKDQDAIWLGNVNGGLRLKLKDENYHSPLVNIYYEFYPLVLPTSWGNGGKGGFVFHTEGGQVKAFAYSGERNMKAKDTLHYNFELMISPFKLLNKEKLFNDRYAHARLPETQSPEYCLKLVKEKGANIVNIHHATNFYPYINYPFNVISMDTLERFVNLAHTQNIRVKPYYTTREITVNLPEFWAFRSLNGEVLFPGPGNNSKTILHDHPDPWMIQNVRDHYLQAWVATFETGRFAGTRDLSVLTTPDSRLNNFYIGGLDWMCKNMGIDGVYIDDCALDRTTIRRARKVIDQYRPAGRMDFHTWNHFCPEGSWANCLNIYMDLLPYFDLAWIGEGRDYDELPDNWMVEMCGIPFGIGSQMLDNGGNPWRGMLYGMTNRLFWAKEGPENLWKFWDKYQIKDKEFIGYWDETNPIKTSSDLVKVTLFKGDKESIIAIAGWAKTDIDVELSIDWKALGMDPSKVLVHAPAIENFQSEKIFDLKHTISIPQGKGYLLLVKEH